MLHLLSRLSLHLVPRATDNRGDRAVQLHERAPACAMIHPVMAREWHTGRIRPFWIFRLRTSYGANLQVRCGGRGIRTHEELAPLAVFKTAAIGL